MKASPFSGSFCVFGKENHDHTIQKNRRSACYDSDILVTGGRIPPDERPQGPFKSCGDCPYPSHGFVCYGSEGDCLRTDMEKIHRKNKKEEPDVKNNAAEA